ncbi:uncharacterized protein LOC134601395 [Pelobates fuscus]|uniref:uncharacterized protein LOC134601395 n=1 Tax=Pelobates fuscus TaxID=191477 RepID=UPI002FE49030
MNKMKNDEHKTEMILNYALEIIYMLTGEEYTVVKKNSRSRRRNIHLVTGEVPVKCDDVAVYFTKEEWEYLQAHKDLYQDVVNTDQQTFSTVGIMANSSAGSITKHLHRRIGVRKITLLSPQSRHRIIKRTRLHLSGSAQFTQLVHSIANLGRRVAKIDRSIYHILKEFKNKNALFPGDHFQVPDKFQTQFQEDEGIFGDCQEPIYQPTETSLPISSFTSLSYPQDMIDPFAKMSAPTLPTNDFSPLNSPSFTIRSEVSEHSHTHSPCTADSTGETLPDTPPSVVPLALHTSAKLPSTATIAVPPENTTSFPNHLRISEKKQAHHDNTCATHFNRDAEDDILSSTGLLSQRTTARLPRLPSSSNNDYANVKGPAFIVVSKILEQQQAHMESLRTPDCVGDPLPDIPLASMSVGLLNNFKMQSRGQPHRYAQLLFQHHVPYSVYKTWTHNTNYDGSRGKHALPKNLKRLIITETSAAFKLTPPVLKKIKDTLNGLLRIPRTGGWDSNSDFI